MEKPKHMRLRCQELRTRYYISMNDAFLEGCEATKGKRKTVNASFYLWCLFNSARGCFCSSCSYHRFSTRLWRGGWEWASPNRGTICCSWIQGKQPSVLKDTGLFKNGNSLMKDKHWSFLLRETHDRLFMLPAQKLAERKMWIGVTGKFYTLWTSGRQKKDYRLIFYFF